MYGTYRRGLVIWIILLGAIAMADCRDSAGEATATRVLSASQPTVVDTPTQPGIPPATLTREAVQRVIEASLTEHPRMTATPEIAAHVTTLAMLGAERLTRQAGEVAFMQTQMAQTTPTLESKQVTIPSGTPPEIDGVIDDGEWSDAANQSIVLDADTQVDVHIKKNEANLYVAYVGLAQSNRQLFPELLLDVQNEGGAQLDENDWWFHVSTSLCWGRGLDAMWQTCDQPERWYASGWQPGTDVVEMAIPYETVGLTFSAESLGIAFGVLEVAEDGQEVRRFWPETVHVDRPDTWAAAVSADP